MSIPQTSGRTMRIFNWRSKADSMLVWDIYTLQHGRALTATKSIGVLNRLQVDSERKEIPEHEPKRPILVMPAGLSVSKTEKRTAKFNSNLAVWRADRDEYNKIHIISILILVCY